MPRVHGMLCVSYFHHTTAAQMLPLQVWNTVFGQTDYALTQAKKLKLHLPENDEFTGLCRFYSMRSQAIFDIIAAQMGGTQRLIRVMSTQVSQSS
jgi:hypothetical protein